MVHLDWSQVTWILGALASVGVVVFQLSRLIGVIQQSLRENEKDHLEISKHQSAQDDLLSEHDRDIARIKTKIRMGYNDGELPNS